ncbi:RluA family pseudouridine synthase [Actinophytocola algeriensis]|uniref:RNA pseudouridylate synthase n=1 Tax=Actinophytocola algeriensis TaxID=1768010 RepID=A0A7W7Q9Y4_9PSEU|nr:RluA family pseudouridine synthase [Actinophytocola algeriensis]MBB4909394.1 tRNA pseudouridine32 synthase/23S rRNA pseudouridine746 synthase [Actinophytocola algeriensis]MBE1475384.1 tRNA pseudouridine32 synthase/23S rRNA pseudouridine746 synthase [Actinophytocola algeriensis]
MRRSAPSPLPQRGGLDAARLRLPEDGEWPTVRAYLVDRLPRVDPARIDAMLADGRFVGRDGPFAPGSPYEPGSFVWFHRDLPDEVPVPFEVGVVYRDEHIVVADKPHFLSTIPRGQHIAETALVRLRTRLDLPYLSPAHRLDRPTAGLVLFVVRPELRGKYQTMFRDRLVHKEYEAIAPTRPELALPTVVRSRIVKERGVITAQEVPGEPNAETRVELQAARDGLGRYRLLPATGRTHQLRLHMCGLGVPILGDPFYPVLEDRPLDDFTRPLQLLAKVLSFDDPVTGEPRRFESRLRLALHVS